MGQIHVLQRRVEVAQQGLALFEEEARGTGARLSEAFGRIEEVLRDKDFQLVRREMEVQRLTRENAQAKMLLETLLETLEQRRLPSLKEVIEEFERKLAASSALGGGEPPVGPAQSGEPLEAAGLTEDEGAPAREADPAEPVPGIVTEAESEPEAATEPVHIPAAAAAFTFEAPPPAPLEPEGAQPPPIAAFADPGGDVTVVAPLTTRDDPAEAAAESAPWLRVPAIAPNDELIADARAQLRSRGGAVAARLIDEEQRRYAYKVWLGPIMIGVGCLGPLALVLARIAH